MRLKFFSCIFALLEINRKIMKQAILLSIIISCSMIDDKVNVIEPELEKYFNIYIEEAYKRGVNPNIDDFQITIKYVDGLSEKKKAWGECSRGDKRRRIISIDTDFVRNQSQKNIHRVERLILHECGHCFLNKDHDSGGIMSTKTYNNGFRENRDKQLDDFYLN
jgi:hypothetical protein